LAVSTKKLLVLNTVDKEDAAYYGTAFIDGNATIKGPTNGLFIKVEAKSEKGTEVKSDKLWKVLVIILLFIF
jgi:hypothetical protein